jgi:hypothetical protein
MVIDVDPCTLRLHPSMLGCADPGKLHRQIVRFGRSTLGMPRIVIDQASDGELVIYDGVTCHGRRQARTRSVRIGGSDP